VLGFRKGGWKKGGAQLRILGLNHKTAACRPWDAEGEMAYCSFEELDVWKRACRMSVRIYVLLKESRDFGLKDQMTRATVSVASNIAEGAEKDTSADFKRFLHIAKGSAAELRTQVYIATRVGILSPDPEDELTPALKRISAMTHGLINSLNRRAK